VCILKAQLLVPRANPPASRKGTFIKNHRVVVFVEQKEEKKDLIFKEKNHHNHKEGSVKSSCTECSLGFWTQ
jgi:hypothetical protein